MGIDQLIIKDLACDVEQLKDGWVAHSVVDGGALFAIFHDIARAQNSKLA
jgi:hypothetical protein